MPRIIALAGSLLLIFVFSTLDISPSPLVKVFSSYFGVARERILWFISVCNGGIVLGVLTGPAIISSFRIKKVTVITGITMLFSVVLFVFAGSFQVGLMARFIYGLSMGLMSTILWWLTYTGVEECFFKIAVAIMVAGRPISVALGIPLLARLQADMGWKSAFLLFAGAMAVSLVVFVLYAPRDGQEKTGFTPLKILGEYFSLFQLPRAGIFYGGLALSRICYMGFYAMLGIWFIERFGLDTAGISKVMFYAGGAESAVIFLIPLITALLGSRRALFAGALFSMAGFGLLYFGSRGLLFAVVFFCVFVVMDRIMVSLVLMETPKLFPGLVNKTLIGNLSTLSAWTVFALISWFEGEYMNRIGLLSMGGILLGALVLGNVIITYVLGKYAVNGSTSVS